MVGGASVHISKHSLFRLTTHFVATAEDCTYRAIKIFGTCITQRTKAKKAIDSPSV